MRKIIQTIKRRNFSFFAILMTFFMLCHTVWIGYIVCILDELIDTDGDIALIIFFLMIVPVMFAVLLSFIAFVVYEDASNKNMVYICPPIILVCLTLLKFSRGEDFFEVFVIFSPIAIVYALGIFIAKKLGAPPSKKEIE